MSRRSKWSNFFIFRQLKQAQFQSLPGTPSGYLAVLFSAENLQVQQDHLAFCQHLQELASLKTTPLVFFPRRLDENVRFAFPHYSTSDLDLFGRPHNKDIDLFLQRSYRAVINLDLANHPSIHLLCHRITAFHKLGVNANLPNLYDIHIQLDEPLEIKQVQDQIEVILTKILD